MRLPNLLAESNPRQIDMPLKSIRQFSFDYRDMSVTRLVQPGKVR